MSTKFIAFMLAAVLAAAGILSLSAPRTAGERALEASVLANPESSQPAAAETSDAYLGDYKTGYADGFNAGVASLAYPEASQMASNARGYLDGFAQGYSDGQNQQASLRNQLCDKNAVGQRVESSSSSSAYSSSTTRRAGVASYRAYNSERRVDNGMGSTARKALLIGGGAAVGAGLGGAIGGGKGALIGALAGGGAGTYMAVKHKPRRAFNRRVTAKHVLTRTAIGAGAGVLIGALAGGKRGALAGAALGGGGGALWGLMSGRRTRR
ncbi:MAG TPA: hypothetical protein VKA60_13320 [Blastocatellia bacterium]|nr:hypothetical protein [Blastocatellia bacterium]